MWEPGEEFGTTFFSPNAINFREPIMDQNVAMYKIHLELAVCQQCVYLYDGEEVNR